MHRESSRSAVLARISAAGNEGQCVPFIGKRQTFFAFFSKLETVNYKNLTVSIPPEKTHKGIVLNLGQRFIKSCGRVFFFCLFFLTGARWEGGGGRYGSETESPDIHKPHGTINPPVDSCLLFSAWGSLCDKGSGILCYCDDIRMWMRCFFCQRCAADLVPREGGTD